MTYGQMPGFERPTDADEFDRKWEEVSNSQGWCTNRRRIWTCLCTDSSWNTWAILVEETATTGRPLVSVRLVNIHRTTAECVPRVGASRASLSGVASYSRRFSAIFTHTRKCVPRRSSSATPKKRTQRPERNNCRSKLTGDQPMSNFYHAIIQGGRSGKALRSATEEGRNIQLLQEVSELQKVSTLSVFMLSVYYCIIYYIKHSEFTSNSTAPTNPLHY